MINIKFYIKIIFLLITSYSYGQDGSGKLVDKENNPIEYASIMNINKKTYTFSDNKGVFKIPFHASDSLEIKHISYKTKRTSINNLSSYITLEHKIVDLEEVIISTNKTNSETIKLGNKAKKNLYGLGTDREYALLIKNQSKNEILVNKVIIPVKFKKDFYDKGVILLQFFNQTGNGLISEKPISKLFTIDISEVKKQIILDLNANNSFIAKSNAFFLVIKRVTPNKVYSKNTKNESVNPFLFFENRKSSNKFLIKDITSNKWITSGQVFNPVFSLNIYGVKIEK